MRFKTIVQAVIMSEYIDLSAITKRLKEVVDRSGLTSRDFAMKAGIAPATLSLNLNEKQQSLECLVCQMIREGISSHLRE